MSKKQALGRGFDGLIPTNFDVGGVANPGESVRQIAVSDIVQNPDQPRRSFDEDAITELADSIKEHGIIQPLVLTPAGEHYRIVAGERRWRAAKQAGLTKVPAIIRNHKELEELEIAIVENVQRVDLSPLEQALSIVRLRDQFSLTPKQISKKLGKAETTISNIVRLLQLPEEAVEALQKNSISEGHARAILALKTDESAQKELLNKIITQKLSVREAEDFVKQKRAQHDTKDESRKLVAKLQPELRKKIRINTKVNGSGKLTVSFNNRSELGEFLDKLNS